MAAGQALDHQPRPGVRPKKRRRDRLIRLAETHPDWVLGFEDEVWWSRLARPALHAWAEADRPLRLVEQAVAKDDPDPKALACYGLLVRWWAAARTARRTRRPGCASSTAARSAPSPPSFLDWCCAEARAPPARRRCCWSGTTPPGTSARRCAAGSAPTTARVKRSGAGVRIVACPLPIKSPWLNPIEPKWVHGKRRVVEPDRLLTAARTGRARLRRLRLPP